MDSARGGADRAAAEHISVIAVGGSWMVARDLIATRNFDEIRRRTAAAVEDAAR